MWYGIIGAIVGVTGGLIGTYASISNVQSPREKRFMFYCAAGVWLSILLFLVLLLLIPQPYNWFVWIPYGILLALAIVVMSRKQTEIRRSGSSSSG